MSSSKGSTSTSDSIKAVDLFCGAGGLSTGLALACEDLDRDVEAVVVNHSDVAIETHKANHDWATHLNAKVEKLHPPDILPWDGNHIDLLVASPECTHFSVARGGKPVSEQARCSPWRVLDYARLQPTTILLENVPELESWGPVVDGKPSRNGEIFEAWVDAIHSLGYSVDWKVLDSANYGDATSRRRLFVVAHRENRPTFPEPTHSESGGGETDPWRPAAEIIDWSDRGESIWQRSRPLVQNTMKRIADGIRRHGHDELQAFADVVASLGKDDVATMQADVVDAGDIDSYLKDADGPFLVEYSELLGDGDSTSLTGTPAMSDGGEVADAGADADPDSAVGVGPGSVRALSTPFFLRQQSGGTPPSPDEPLPTITTRGAIAKINADSFVLPRNGAYRGLHSNPAYDPSERPLHTVTAENSDGHLVSPFLIEYYGNGASQPVEDPLPTVTTKDRFALIVPELWPVGLDIRYRMLKPSELAAAMSFPDWYTFAGNKTETTRQIGNAVPVRTAKALVKHLLTEDAPSLRSYGAD